MKNLICSIFVLIFTTTIYAKDIQELVVTTTPPMSCQNCENKIKGNLRFEKGIKKIETNIPDQKVTVEYDADKTNPEKIEKAFEKIGYRVKVVENLPENCVQNPGCQKEQGTCCRSKAETEQNCCK